MIAGAIVVFLIAIGIAFPANDSNVAQDTSTGGNGTEPTTSASTAVTTQTTEVELATTEAAAQEPPLRKVARVIDGDTLVLDNGAHVRLVQIDAPEAKGECYGRKGGTVLRRLLPVGTRVQVTRDPNLDGVDRYGRLLRYVFIDKQNINLVLVKKGAASVWYFNGDKGQYAGALLRAAKDARRHSRGAWGACRARLDPLRAFQTHSKKPPPPPPPPPPTCDPNYKGACLDPNAYDYDCAGGSGDGPKYVRGPIRVVGDDHFRLDADGDGIACE